VNRFRLTLIAILAFIMVGNAYSERYISPSEMILLPGPCRVVRGTYAFKNYKDVKEHILLIANGESDTPFINEGLRDGKIVSVDTGASVKIIEEMDFHGIKIWMFSGGPTGSTLYSWKRLAFECYSKDKINDKFINAAYEGDLGEVKRWLDLGADINAKNSIGQTALFLASMYRHQEVVTFLEAKGAKK